MGISVWFINVGYGDAAYCEVDLPEGRRFRMLVDGGSAHKAGPVLNLLAERGVRELDLMVCTHLHEDHAAGLALAAGQLERITEFWTICSLPAEAQEIRVDPGWAYYTRKTGESLNACLRLQTRLLPALGARVRTVAEGDLKPGYELMLAPGVRVELLWAGGAGAAATAGQLACLYREPEMAMENLYAIDQSANAACMVLRLAAGDAAVLLPGDTPAGWWAGVDPGRLRAGVLKLAHHGAADATTAELVRFVRPDLAVLSAGLDRTDRPEPAVAEALGPVPLYRTESQPGSRYLAVSWLPDNTLAITKG